MRTAKKMREDADRCGDPPGSFVLEVAGWLETEARMVALRGNSSEGQTFHALNAARAYLGEQETEPQS
jgi:hypothetical protein